MTAQRQKLILRNQNLVLQLPDGKNWQGTARRGDWSGVVHSGSESEIWVRHVPARRTVSLDECRDSATRSLSYLRQPLSVAHERITNSPEGYGGQLRVSLVSGGGAQVSLTAVGVSRCLAIVFRTEEGPGFAELIQVITNETFATLRIPDIGERGLEKRF